MYSLLPNIAFVATLLCLFVQRSSAVALHDFTPRQYDLTGECATVYATTIDGCEGSDFENSKCSTTCISALKSTGNSVKKSCTGQGDSGSIISAFLNGQGVTYLCPNAASATSAASSSTAQSKEPIIGASTLVLSSASVEATGLIIDTSSTPSVKLTAVSTSSATEPLIHSVTASSTATIQSQQESMITPTSTVGSALAFDTSTPTSVMEAASETSASSSSKQVKSAKQTEDAGGSPFDTVSGSARLTLSIASLIPAALACLLLL